MPVKKLLKNSGVKYSFTNNKQNVDIQLMDNPSIVSSNIQDYIWMIYGERKIGKTTLFSMFPNTYFLMFDPKKKGLSLRQTHIPSWEHFLKAIQMIKDKLDQNPHWCDMVVIDTGYVCYERCYAYMIKKMGITDPQDKAWGAAWKAIGREFMEAHDKIFQLNVGFGVTAHSEIINIKRKDGTSYDKLTTQLGGQAFKFYNGLTDIIAYYQYNTYGHRELIIKGDSFVEAGAASKGHFKYTNGNPIDVIPMGFSEEEAYQNLLQAFNNKLVETRKKEVKKLIKKQMV